MGCKRHRLERCGDTRGLARAYASPSSVVTASQAQGAALVGPNGERLELPPDVFEILREVVEALAGGQAQVSSAAGRSRLP